MPPEEKEDAEMNLTWSRVLAIGVAGVSTAISKSREMDAQFWLEKADADRDT
jgi:hypothetical protein